MPKGSNGCCNLWPAAARLLISLAAMIPAAAASSEFSGSITLTSEYISRGQAVSDQNPALQASLDYDHDSGIFGGLWASTIDIENPFSQRDREVDVYVGYHVEPWKRLALTGTLIRYTYPGQRGFIDYDYTEALVALTLDGRHTLEFGYAQDLWGLGGIGRHWELRSDWPLKSAWVIGAGAGYNDLTDYGGNRYLHWDLGASARVSWLTVDLRWFDNEDPGVSIGGPSAGSRFVASLSVVF